MIDREKVIEILNNAKTIIEKWVPMFEQYNTPAGIDDAIALLKEQEAVPVVQREVMHMLFWCCGSCGVAITEGDKFCRMCGKKVKWKGCEMERVE